MKQIKSYIVMALIISFMFCGCTTNDLAETPDPESAARTPIVNPDEDVLPNTKDEIRDDDEMYDDDNDDGIIDDNDNKMLDDDDDNENLDKDDEEFFDDDDDTNDDDAMPEKEDGMIGNDASKENGIIDKND